MASSFNIFGESRPQSYLGIDIGTLSIKIVELSSENGRPKLENYAILDDYGLARQSSAAEEAATAKIFGGKAAVMIRRLVKESGIQSREVNMSVPIYSSFLTVMELPQMSETELMNAVKFEAKKYIPVPMDSVIIDWTVVGSGAANRQTTPPPASQSEGNVSVLLIAIPKDLINEYSGIAADSGLRLLNIELETVSAARALIGNDPVPAILLDMGSRDTTVSIVENGSVRISHSIETSGEDLTRALSESLKIDWRRAEDLKRENGLRVVNGNGQIADVLTPLVDTIADAVKNISDLYFSKTGKKIDKLITYGGAARMPEFNGYLKNKLQIDAMTGVPFGRIAYPEKLKPAIDDIGCEFTIAAGLALKAMQ